MPGYGFPLTAIAIMLLSSILCAGCMSTSVGDAGYANQSITAVITHAGEPLEAHVQITVYRLANMTQEQVTILGAPVSLQTGRNTISVPVRLDPGAYKLYIYVIKDGDRKTAVIRDITV